MQFYSIDQLTGHTDQEVFETHARCKSLTLKVVAADYGIWGMKGVSDDVPTGVTFITLLGQQTAFADLGSGVTGTADSGVRLVNEALGTNFLFGRTAANFADPTTLVRRANSNDGLVQQFIQALMSQTLLPGDSHVALVVGLPNDDMKVDAFKDGLRDKLKGLHVFSNGTDTWNVLVPMVMFQPQASGAMFYDLIDPNGAATDELNMVRSATTAHITIGGGTAELLLMRPIIDDEGTRKVEPDYLRSKSRPAGVNVLRQHLRDTVFADLTAEQMPNDADIDDMIETARDKNGNPIPKTIVAGKRLYHAWWDGRQDATGATKGWVDLDPYIRQGEAKMEAALERLVADTVGLDNVDIQYVFVAGGAKDRVLPKVVSIFGSDRVFTPGQRPGMTAEEKEAAQAPVHPERIVAHGLYRYGRYELARYLARRNRS